MRDLFEKNYPNNIEENIKKAGLMVEITHYEHDKYLTAH